MIYRQQGTGAQLETWLQMAERQLAELERQRSDLDATIADLKTLRDATILDMARTPDPV